MLDIDTHSPFDEAIDDTLLFRLIETRKILFFLAERNSVEKFQFVSGGKYRNCPSKNEKATKKNLLKINNAYLTHIVANLGE